MSKKTDMDSRVLSERELADELGISFWTVRNLRLKLGLPHFRTSRRIFYRLDTVQEWMSAQEKRSSNKFVESETTGYGTLRQVR